MSSREQQINVILHLALKRPEDERLEFIREVCQGDPALQTEVQGRLQAYQTVNPAAQEPAFPRPFSNHSDTTKLPHTQETPDLEISTQIFLDAPTIGLTEEEHATLFVEPHIGNYRIIRQIGQGGMGSVYLAERDDEEFKKLVAIKVVSQGMANEFVIQRFRNERQILASLDHPNIARLLDGGSTEDGRPYFVMEYVQGLPITQYCDEKRLSIAKRLKLFRKVCSAVHYAHQNLVIHRDIKPSNILVTEDGVPKLLDFGIAKLLNPELVDSNLDVTATFMRLMTPEYASPEQVKGEAITTASDIYTLGVLLYQLLTGHKPYRLTSRSAHEIARVICEQEPEKPSTAIKRVETLTGLDGTSVTLSPEVISKARDGKPDKLRKRLTGDVDNIVLMAMRKEPERRYASVDQLSNDLHRHLQGLPVIAHGDSLLYRSNKFIRRHKFALLAAALLAVTLLGGIVATTIQKRKAEQRFNDVRQLANSFMFEFHDAIEHLPGSTPARELLVRRALEYLDGLAHEASSDISLQRELATAYLKVGDVQGNPATGNLGDTEGALKSYNKALDILEALRTDGSAEAPDKRLLGVAYANIGNLHMAKGNLAGAIDFHQKAVTIDEALLAQNPDDLETARHLWHSYTRLAYAETQSGDLTAAIALFRKGQELGEKRLLADPANPDARHDMAVNYSSMGDLLGETRDHEGALEMFRKALAIDQQLFAEEPANTQIQTRIASDYNGLGEVLLRQGEAQAALDNFTKSLAITDNLAKADPQNAQAQRNLVISYEKLGQAQLQLESLNQAFESFRKAEALLVKTFDPAHTDMLTGAELAVCHNHMALILAKRGEEAEAFDYSNRAKALAEKLAEAHPSNTELRSFLALTYTNFGKVNATLAESKRLAVSRQIAFWTEARNWYQKGFEILNDLQTRGEYIISTYGSPKAAAKEIARCEAALAKLRSAT
jgi:non-specific serine/threonine protein kinase/serine/threonine-protein kinase